MALNEKQTYAYQQIKEGKSIFITGAGGCGKTFLIKHIKNTIDDKVLYVTALTGTAATLLGGTTVHSWGGLSDAKKAKEIIVSQLLSYNKDAVTRWRETDLLIIDEISMMSCEMFNKLNYIAMKIRGNETFFGGMQLLLSGDFCQLPPPEKTKFCFESETWKTNFNKDNIVYLTEIFRQDNIEFQRLLNEVRLGSLSTDTKLKLNNRLLKNFPDFDKIQEASGITPTILYPHHDNVDEINKEQLYKLALEISKQTNEGDNKSLPSTEPAALMQLVDTDLTDIIRIYKCKDTFTIKNKADKTAVAKKVVTEMKIKDAEKQSLVKILDMACPLDKAFRYVIGAQVMLMINHDLELGLVNGSRGVIMSLSDKNHPVVAFDNGKTLEVKPYKWILEHPRYNISRKQYPLTLAWAMTIHKSQGSTLNMIKTDLSKVFAHGQAYVTLSRVRTLEGLYLAAINYSKIKCDPLVKKFYQELL